LNNAFYINVSPIIFKNWPDYRGLVRAYGSSGSHYRSKLGSLASCQNQDNYPDTILTGALIGIPSGVIFSKVLHVIDQWRYYLENPGRILSGEGLTIWGAVIGATIGVWAYSKISKGFRFTLLGDLIAPGIILSQAIGRVGCTFNGCCYGLESHSWYSVIYTDPHTYAPIGIPVLPTPDF